MLVDAVAERLRRAGRRPKVPCVVLAGHARIGKSALARHLARDHGYVVLSTDDLRDAHEDVSSEAERFALELDLYRRILAVAEHGLVLEGDRFVRGVRHANGRLPPMLEELRRGPVAGLYLVGCRRCTAEDKYRVLRFLQLAGRCWTRGHEDYATPEGLRVLAAQSVEVSGLLEEQARSNGLVYLDIDPRRFHDDVRRAAAIVARGGRDAGAGAKRAVARPTTSSGNSLAAM